mmetsp:Transcript_11955/g.24287  ORF Transcript_11955/g.24287 Transcript_11955/m.24287 type:complete len:228 (-) Transcript_11955:132-815(-)
MVPKLVALMALVGFPGAFSFEAALSADDECLADADCSLSALQLRGTREEQPENGTLSLADAGMAGDLEWHGWSQGGDKVWGSGPGMESINIGNVGYYDKGMDAARARCGGPGCALITNPVHHRSINQFHIHFVHYQGYGASLKSKAEARVCGKPGWHSGGLPCHGKVAFFGGFPGIFSKAMTGGDLHHASVIAWPSSCGGTGTIVELAFHCSIEHQIRGDFNAHHHR